MILSKCVRVSSRLYWRKISTPGKLPCQYCFVHNRASNNYFSSLEEDAAETVSSSTAAPLSGASSSAAAETMVDTAPMSASETVIAQAEPLSAPTEVLISTQETLIAPSEALATVPEVVFTPEAPVASAESLITPTETIEVLSSAQVIDSAEISAAAAEVLSQQVAAVEALSSEAVSTAADAAVAQPAAIEATTAAVQQAADVVSSTPAAEAVVAAAAETKIPLLDAFAPVVDPSFIELGLATGHWPYQYMQSALELVNLSTDMPWWATIALGTLVFRVATLPIFLYSRKFSVKMSNHMPEQQELLKKITQAKDEGDPMEVQQAQAKFAEFGKRTGVTPLKSLLVNLPMPFMFISWLTALRQMVAVPVPSLDACSLGWIDSLCEADTYMLLPLATGGTFALSIHLSMKATGATEGRNELLKKFGKYIPAIPVLAVPLLFGNSAAAVLVYMTSNATFTLVSSVALNNEAVKTYLQMPERATRDSEGRETKGFMEMWNDQKQGMHRRARLRGEAREIKKEKKALEKARKKELKGDPPTTYRIGTEAVERTSVPDFQQDTWKPQRTYVIQR